MDVPALYGRISTCWKWAKQIPIMVGGSKNLQRLAKPFLQRMELNDLEKTLQPLFDNWKSNLDLDFGDFINTQDESSILNLLNKFNRI